MTTQLIVSITGPEEMGFINKLTKNTHQLGGRWLANKLTHLEGRMAGLLKLEIAVDKVEEFKKMVSEFEAITVQYHNVVEGSALNKTPVKMTIEGEDRSGLISDITHLLYDADVTVEQFESQRFAVAELGTGVFEAQLSLKLPLTLSVDTLKSDLEALSDRLRVFLVNP